VCERLERQFERASEPEVADLHVLGFVVDEHILGFEVPVHDAALVAVHE